MVQVTDGANLALSSICCLTVQFEDLLFGSRVQHHSINQATERPVSVQRPDMIELAKGQSRIIVCEVIANIPPMCCFQRNGRAITDYANDKQILFCVNFNEYICQTRSIMLGTIKSSPSFSRFSVGSFIVTYMYVHRVWNNFPISYINFLSNYNHV